MNTAPAKYVLDANAFIQAKRKVYGLDFCPGYSATLSWHEQRGRLCSIDKVRDELLRGADELATWVEQQFGASAFADTSTREIAAAYAQMLVWVMAQPHFLEAAQAEFQQVADGWLAAYAKRAGAVATPLTGSLPGLLGSRRLLTPRPRSRKGRDTSFFRPSR